MTDIDLTKPHRTRDGREVWLAPELGPDGKVYGAICLHSGMNGWLAQSWDASTGMNCPPNARGSDLIPIKTAEEVMAEAMNADGGWAKWSKRYREYRAADSFDITDIANALREAGLLTEGE